LLSIISDYLNNCTMKMAKMCSLQRLLYRTFSLTDSQCIFSILREILVQNPAKCRFRLASSRRLCFNR